MGSEGENSGGGRGYTLSYLRFRRRTKRKEKGFQGTVNSCSVPAKGARSRIETEIAEYTTECKLFHFHDAVAW